ncbi:MAG: hypothetical protein NTX44_09935 [Ignavibacteriales bacterium]|nr:hypothetical protein [Ignavibacteriales bacterium]
MNQPRENAPEFVKGSISINVDKFIPYLKSKAVITSNGVGYVNINLLLSKEGKLYAKLDDWKPNGAKSSSVKQEVSPDKAIAEEEKDINVADIPF